MDTFHKRHQSALTIFTSSSHISSKVTTSKMKSKNIVAPMKLGYNKPLLATTVTMSPNSSDSNNQPGAASPSLHKRQNNHVLNADTVHHGTEQEKTLPLINSLTSSNVIELAIPILESLPKPASNDIKDTARRSLCKWKLKHRALLRSCS